MYLATNYSTMKKSILFILFLSFIFCSDDNDPSTFLPYIPVNETVHLNLHGNLYIAGNSETVPGGISGIIVYNFNGNDFLAWEAACPHITPSQCSKMNVEGVLMVCACDSSRFSILDGSPQDGTPYPARQYRVVKNGDVLHITNY